MENKMMHKMPNGHMMSDKEMKVMMKKKGMKKPSDMEKAKKAMKGMV